MSAFATWDLCRLSWSLSVHGTFVASVGCLRYEGLLSPELIALRYVGPFVASVGRLRYARLGY